MFKVRKTAEGYYLATMSTSNTVLKRVDCTLLKHALSDVLKPHREISIDIRGVRSIEIEGFRILEDLKRRADMKNCRLRFINVDAHVSPAIKKLMERKAQLQDELELL